MLFGIYAVFHGLFRLFSERGPRDFTIGPDANTLFNAPGEYLPVGSFPLVHSTGTDYELLFTQQMSGDVTVNGQTIPLAQLAQSGQARQSGEVAGALRVADPERRARQDRPRAEHVPGVVGAAAARLRGAARRSTGASRRTRARPRSPSCCSSS